MSLSGLARFTRRSTTTLSRRTANQAKYKASSTQICPTSSPKPISTSTSGLLTWFKDSTPLYRSQSTRCFHSTSISRYLPKFDLPEIHEAQDLLAQNKLVKAEAVATRALEIAKYAVGEKSVEYIQVVELVARCKFGRGQFQESVKLYQACVETFMKAGEVEASLRCLPLLVMSSLRANGKLDLSSVLACVKQCSSSSKLPLDPRVAIAVAQALVQLSSIEYHKYLLANSHSQMQETEEAIRKEISRVDLSSLPPHSLESSSWHLTIGRWYYSLYQLRREDSTLEEAKKAFGEASKVGAVGPESQRTADLIKADALLGLGDLARLAAKWEEADEHYKFAVDLTDKYFDRDSQRVRRVIEREAIVQYHLKRWLHAEGLLRRLLDYYNEHSPVVGEALPQAQMECMQNYVKMMESRGRGSETESLKSKLASVTTVLPYPTFDPYAF